MKKSIIGFALVTALSVAAVPASAGYKHEKRMGFMEHVCAKIPGICAKFQEKHAKKSPTAPHAVPEIDAANAGLALALLGGVVAIRRERRNRRQA